MRASLIQSVGFVNQATIASFMWPPAPDVLIIVCGPYPMCKALKGVFAKMGYSVGSGPEDMVYSYM